MCNKSTLIYHHTRLFIFSRLFIAQYYWCWIAFSSLLRKNSWGKKSQSCISECSRMLITHVHSKKERKKKHISESWQSTPCYFPKTLPKHSDVFFCTHAHTHTSYPLKRLNLRNRPTALAGSEKNGVWGTALAKNRDAPQPRTDGSALTHCWS